MRFVPILQEKGGVLIYGVLGDVSIIMMRQYTQHDTTETPPNGGAK
jgi:hypothetical protein